MPEVTVKYKDKVALKALKDLAKLFDLVIEKPVMDKADQQADLPITFAQKPDVTALAGIWENTDISLEDLRKQAWGNRL